MTTYTKFTEGEFHILKVSFVIPCYRSQKTIEMVCQEIIDTVSQRTDVTYEIIAVNDASPDGVIHVLNQMADEDPRIKVIDFAKNMGKHAALIAGFRYASGDYVVCVDDDYQCPVDQLWRLLAPLEEGYDVSMAQYGVKAESRFKNFGSRVNAWMMTTMLGKPKDFQFANFAAMKPYVVKEMVKYDNAYTYINGLILRTTSRIINVPMQERERAVGVGGYTFFKSLKLWIDGFTAFSIKPLRFAMFLGMGFSAVGFIGALVVLIDKLVQPNLSVGTAAILFVLALVGGILMMLLGLLGEYVGRIYMCINHAPQYIIRGTKNLENAYVTNK